MFLMNRFPEPLRQKMLHFDCWMNAVAVRDVLVIIGRRRKVIIHLGEDIDSINFHVWMQPSQPWNACQ